MMRMPGSPVLSLRHRALSPKSSHGLQANWWGRIALGRHLIELATVDAPISRRVLPRGRWDRTAAHEWMRDLEIDHKAHEKPAARLQGIRSDTTA